MRAPIVIITLSALPKWLAKPANSITVLPWAVSHFQASGLIVDLLLFRPISSKPARVLPVDQ